MHLKCFIRNRLINIDPLFKGPFDEWSHLENQRKKKEVENEEVEKDARPMRGNPVGPRERCSADGL